MFAREEQLYMAKLGEQAEEFEGMYRAMKKVALMTPSGQEMTVEERNLLSVAAKNLIGARRAAWRTISSIEQKERSKDNDDSNNSTGSNIRLEMCISYRKKIEHELEHFSYDMIEVVQTLLSNSQLSESKVFYHKMIADYWRYMAEIFIGSERKEFASKSQISYESAAKLAISDLPAWHPVRLGLFLNFSVFEHEIMNNPNKSCSLAKDAFDAAIAVIDTLSEESYKDSTLIMQLLRGSFPLWTSDMNGDDDKTDDT